jgi:hypothetical protein
MHRRHRALPADSVLTSVGNRARTSRVALVLAVATLVCPASVYAGAPTGCAVTDEIVELKRVLGDVATLQHLADLQAKVEKARESRGADQPRWFEQIRFRLYLMRDAIARQNRAAATSLILPHADTVLGAYVTIRRVESFMERVVGLRRQVAGETAVDGPRARELAAIDVMARPPKAGEPPRAEPRTVEECLAVLDAAYDALKAKRDIALKDLGASMDVYRALMSELQGRIRSKREAEYTPEEKMIARILETAGFERLRTLAPELVGRYEAPTLEAIDAMIKASPIAVEARLTAMLKAERGATFFGVLWQAAVLNNPQYNALILRYLPKWKPFVELFQRVASDNLYFERHYAVIDQILPTRPPEGWRDPSPADAYKFLLEKYTSLGDPLLISFFRRKASTDWPQKLMDHMATLTTEEGKRHTELFAAARKAALALGPLPEYQGALRGEQVASAVLHTLLMMAVMSGTGYGTWAMLDDKKVTLEELEEAIREGEGRHASLSGSSSSDDRAAVALLDAASRSPVGVRLDGMPATEECFQ